MTQFESQYFWSLYDYKQPKSVPVFFSQQQINAWTVMKCYSFYFYFFLDLNHAKHACVFALITLTAMKFCIGSGNVNK